MKTSCLKFRKEDCYTSYYIKYFTEIKVITTVINIYIFKTFNLQFYLHASPLKEQPPEGNGLETGLFKTENPLLYWR